MSRAESGAGIKLESLLCGHHCAKAHDVFQNQLFLDRSYRRVPRSSHVLELLVTLPYCVGYIGGAVLLRLLNHPNASSFKITALVRSREKADKLKALGVEAVVGSLSDVVLLEALAAEAHVVIAMAR
jgi:hypothetical protein